MRALIIKLRALDDPVQPERPITRSAVVSLIAVKGKSNGKMRRRDKRKVKSMRKQEDCGKNEVAEECWDVWKLECLD